MLVQNHGKEPFDPKYIGDYRVVSLKGNQVEVQSANGGPTEMKHITHVYLFYLFRYFTRVLLLQFCITSSDSAHKFNEDKFKINYN